MAAACRAKQSSPGFAPVVHEYTNGICHLKDGTSEKDCMILQNDPYENLGYAFYDNPYFDTGRDVVMDTDDTEYCSSSFKTPSIECTEMFGGWMADLALGTCSF